MTKRLGPGDVPQNSPVHVIHGDSDGLTDEEPSVKVPAKDVIAEMTGKLQELRAPFPPDMIEKLPKPLWKGAWTDKRGGRCNVCHGYHVLEDCIHLDYVGHANTTNRLLEVDPFWEWEPMAYTEAGTPLFSDGGLWIKLTVCGVTRIGFGDGNSVKEVIGDAIRNAAMRFGVALDLWSKIDLHAERNPGDGTTQAQRNTPRDSGQTSTRHQDERVAQTAPPRAPNQDALDELLSICTRNGLDPRHVEATYNDKYGPPKLVQASEDDIRNYAALILDQLEGGPASGSGDPEDVRSAEPAPADSDTGGQAEAGAEVRPGDGPEGGSAGGDGEVLGTDPTDTSDVEKKPDEAF